MYRNVSKNTSRNGSTFTFSIEFTHKIFQYRNTQTRREKGSERKISSKITAVGATTITQRKRTKYKHFIYTNKIQLLQSNIKWKEITNKICFFSLCIRHTHCISLFLCALSSCSRSESRECCDEREHMDLIKSSRIYNHFRSISLQRTSIVYTTLISRRENCLLYEADLRRESDWGRRGCEKKESLTFVSSVFRLLQNSRNITEATYALPKLYSV